MVDLRKILVLSFILFSIQSCIRYYSEKEYFIYQDFTNGELEKKEEKENNYIKEETLNVDIRFYGTKLTMYIHENRVSKFLYLNNIKLYDQDKIIGKIEINRNLLEIDNKRYTNAGELINEIELRDQF